MTFTPGTNYYGTAVILYTVEDELGQVAQARLTVQVPPVADLSIQKTDDVDTYVPGGSLTYTITVTNESPIDVNGATITDSRPAQITTWTWTCAPGNTTCDGMAKSSSSFSDTVDFQAGESLVYSVTAKTASGAAFDLVNSAAVEMPSGYTDPDTSNNIATDTDMADPQTDLILTKQVNLTKFSPGSTLVYTLEVTNQGLSDAQYVVVTDPLPAEVQYISANPAPVDANDTPLNWELGTLQASETVTITLTVQVQEGVTDSFSNAASVTSETRDITSDNNTSAALTSPEAPTPVELLYFHMKGSSANKVIIQWAAATEVDMYGYRLMRAEEDNLSSAVEVAYVSLDASRTYQVEDAVSEIRQYWYWLIEVNTYGAEKTIASSMVDLNLYRHQVNLPIVRR